MILLSNLPINLLVDFAPPGYRDSVNRIETYKCILIINWTYVKLEIFNEHSVTAYLKMNVDRHLDLPPTNVTLLEREYWA